MAVTVQSIGDFSSKNSGTSLNVDAPVGVTVGDLLVLHVATDGNSVTTPSGWTAGPNLNSASTTARGYSFYKIADSGDAAAGSFTIETGSGGTGARCFRIDGHDGSAPINTSNSGTAASSTVTVTTVTPTRGNSLILFLVNADSDGSARTCSGYTMATSSPSFTEHYDDQWDTNGYQMSAASGLRPETTATGNITATLDGSDPNVGLVLAIQPPVTNVTISADALVVTISVPAPTIITDAVFSVSVLTMSTTINSPTVEVVVNPWQNESKSAAPTWTNLPKT